MLITARKFITCHNPQGCNLFTKYLCTFWATVPKFTYLLLFEAIVFVPVFLKIEQINKRKLPPNYCSLMAVYSSLSITVQAVPFAGSHFLHLNCIKMQTFVYCVIQT